MSKVQRKELGLATPWKKKAWICVCGNFHPGIFEQVSTTNADAHLVRVFLAAEVKEGNVLVSADVRNAFLNAEMSSDVLIFMRPSPDLE